MARTWSLTVEFTDKEYRRNWRRWWLRSHDGLLWFLGLFIPVSLWVVVCLNPGLYVFVGFASAYGMLTLSLFLSYLAYGGPALRARQRLGTQRFTLEFDEAGLTFRSAISTERILWLAFVRIVTMRHVYALVHAYGGALFLPRNAIEPELLDFLRKTIRPLPRKVPDPKCHICGYDLRGLPEPRCPECGTPFDAALAPPVRVTEHEPP